ncbi:unnamed protein product [Linum trigynum]|uniref:Reverse transcriptase n=1 Tax=Linum trigynum TaxID=586398 RepID=A0AAV2FEL7_9ROSI
MAISRHELHGVHINSRCPPVSHLLFAYDSFLFLQASRRDATFLLQVLRDYESISGQRVNLQKPTVYYSPNMLQPEQEELGSFVGVGSIGLQDRYLGLPSLLGRSKMETFCFIEEKLMEVLQGWKQRALSILLRQRKFSSNLWRPRYTFT